MTHLTPGEFVDLLEGALERARARHLDVCDACRREAASMRELLREAAGVDVPDPPPAEWAALAARVVAAVEAEPAPGWSWLSWLRPPVLVPLAGMAAVILLLAVTVERLVPPGGAWSQARSAIERPFEDHEAWPAMAGFLAALDPDDPEAMSDAGLDLRPGWSERLLADLDADEWSELVRLVSHEAGVPQS
jgi:hypothetical protein